MRRIRLGKRTLKTALAVILSLWVGRLVQLEQPLLAGFSAIVVMQTSLFSSLEQGKNRMLATITGAIIAMIIVSSGYLNYFTIGLGTIIVILLCNYFNWTKSISLGCMVMLIIVVDVGDKNTLIYALNRTLDTFIGIVVGTLINLFVFPPHPLRWIFDTYASIEGDLFRVFREFIDEEKPMALDLIQQELVQANADYRELMEQRRYRLIKKEKLMELEEINRLLYQVVSHMTVVGSSNEHRVLSRRAIKKVRRILPDLEMQTTTSHHDLYDDIYSYHMERIAELLLVLREKIHAIYDKNPKALRGNEESKR